MLTFLIIVFGVYALLVMTLAFGWARSMEHQPSPAGSERTVAIIVPFRNEAATLAGLVQNLKSIRYPSDKVEFIMVDDHSEDSSGSMVSGAVGGDSRFGLLSLSGSAIGKKIAITTAISQTDAEVIVTTDADCKFDDNWINTISGGFSNAEVRMLVGPVRLTDRSFFGQLQAMEFASLVGTAGATLSYGVASMCNGANLAFKRESFIEVGGYAGNATITSGDDEFLMKKFSARWKNRVHFLKGADGVVEAQPAVTVSDFFRQRLRWAGKWRADFSYSSMIALAVLAFHSCNILLMSGWILGMFSSKVFAVLAGSKLFAELIFLFPVCRFLKLRWRWTSFLFLQFAYSFYVIGVGILSQVLTTRWKGREVVTRAQVQ